MQLVLTCTDLNLVAVVIAFIICYAPFHAQRLITSGLQFQMLARSQRRIITIFYFISGILYYLGSTINPIFYHLFSKKYREACQRTMRRLIHCRTEQNNFKQRTPSSARLVVYGPLTRSSMRGTMNEHLQSQPRHFNYSSERRNQHFQRSLRFSAPDFRDRIG